MIRFRVSLGIDMKRILFLLLALLLLLTGCSDERTFSMAGKGYVDRETDICYTILDMAYEADAYSEAWGSYTDEKYEYTLTFYVIPDMDSALFLTDEYSNVYYGGETPIDAATWEIDWISFFEESMILENFRFSSDGEEQATVSALRDLWFEGEAVMLPLDAPESAYAVKFKTKELVNLSYSIYLRLYEDGSAYLCDKAGERAVRLSDELVGAVLDKEK